MMCKQRVFLSGRKHYPAGNQLTVEGKPNGYYAARRVNSFMLDSSVGVIVIDKFHGSFTSLVIRPTLQKRKRVAVVESYTQSSW